MNNLFKIKLSILAPYKITFKVSCLRSHLNFNGVGPRVSPLDRVFGLGSHPKSQALGSTKIFKNLVCRVTPNGRALELVSLITPLVPILGSHFKYTLIFFHKQPVYMQLALGWSVAKQFSELNPLSLCNNKIYRLKLKKLLQR